MVRPTIGRPCCCSTAATVEESTPPDMATATRPGSIAALVGNVVSGWAVRGMVFSILPHAEGSTGESQSSPSTHSQYGSRTEECRFLTRSFAVFHALGRHQKEPAELGLRPIGGRELTELSDGAGNGFESESDVGGRSVAAETEADGGAGVFRRQTDGGEHVRRFDGARGASGAGGAGETLQVEGDDEGFAFDAGKGDVRGVGSARCRGGVGTSVRDSCQQAAFEFVSQQGDARGVFFECSARELGGFTKADNAGDIFRTGPEATLMMAAVE